MIREKTEIPDKCLIDLHLHLDGSLSEKTVRKLAAEQNMALPETEAELLRLLRVPQPCGSLNDYLKAFDFPLSLMQTEEALVESVRELCAELSEDGLIYAEIRFAPQLHTRKGLTQEDVVKAAAEGLKQSGFMAKLILCCMRGKGNISENLETVMLAAKYAKSGVAAVDLAGAEALYPTVDFAYALKLASSLGVPFTVHAGEAAGAESVRAALKLGAKRIGHGVRSYEDPTLLYELAEKGIAVEFCPTSNLNTHVFENISEYPLKKFTDAGVRVTVNTDNMSVSGVTLRHEFLLLADTFSLTRDDIKDFLLNSAEASFAEATLKKKLVSEILSAFGE